MKQPSVCGFPVLNAEETGLAEHSEVELSLAEGALLIRPVSRPFTLEELLAGVTENNAHGEVDTGRPVGRERLCSSVPN